MAYKLILTKNAYRDVKRFDRITKKRIRKKIENYSKFPVKNTKKLTNPAYGTYRWRIGVYRVVFDIEGKDIVILRIRHRKEVYK